MFEDFKKKFKETDEPDSPDIKNTAHAIELLRDKIRKQKAQVEMLEGLLQLLIKMEAAENGN